MTIRVWWWQIWRAARQKQVPSQESPPKSTREVIDLHTVLTEMAKGRLELEKLQLSAETERVKATAADRAEERAYEHKLKMESRERQERHRELNRQNMAKVRGAKRTFGVPPFASTCEDCRAALEGRKPQHNNDMWRHHAQRHVAALAAMNGTE